MGTEARGWPTSIEPGYENNPFMDVSSSEDSANVTADSDFFEYFPQQPKLRGFIVFVQNDVQDKYEKDNVRGQFEFVPIESQLGRQLALLYNITIRADDKRKPKTDWHDCLQADPARFIEAKKEIFKLALTPALVRGVYYYLFQLVFTNRSQEEVLIGLNKLDKKFEEDSRAIEDENEDEDNSFVAQQLDFKRFLDRKHPIFAKIVDAIDPCRDWGMFDKYSPPFAEIPI